MKNDVDIKFRVYSEKCWYEQHKYLGRIKKNVLLLFNVVACSVKYYGTCKVFPHFLSVVILCDIHDIKLKTQFFVFLYSISI